MTKTLRSILACAVVLLLVACGGRGDDGMNIPAGAVECKLKEMSTGTIYSAATTSDIYGINGLIPGLAYSVYLLTPTLVVSEDMVFTVTTSFSYLPPQPEARRYVFYVEEYVHPRAGATTSYQCVVVGLQNNDKVYLSGGEGDYPRRFYVRAWATIVLDDGRVVASEEASLLIER